MRNLTANSALKISFNEFFIEKHFKRKRKIDNFFEEMLTDEILLRWWMLTQIWANLFMSRGQVVLFDNHNIHNKEFNIEWNVKIPMINIVLGGVSSKKRNRSQACLIFQLKIVALSINPGENASQVDKICSLRSFGHTNVLSLNRVLCLSSKSDFIDLPKKHKNCSKKAIFVEIWFELW